MSDDEQGLNTMTADSIELDGATVARIIAGAGKPVQFSIVMSTPGGKVVSLTAKGTWDAAAEALQIEIA